MTQNYEHYLRTILTHPYSWASIYELPFLNLLAMFTHVAGLSDQLIQVSESDDPQEAMFRSLDTEEDLEWNPPLNGNFEVKHLLGLYHALIKSMACLMTYDCYMDELVNKVINGDDSALFKMIRIDRSAVACPTIADRIALAEIECDEKFFNNLGKAFRNGPPKQSADYPDLRYLLPSLDEWGVLDRLTQQEKYELFVKELEVYPDSEDAPRSLHQFIYRWKKRRHST